jgi:Uma2 family endonuclease
MPVAVEILSATAEDVQPRPKRWTVEEFRQLSEADVIPPKARIELIEGELFETAAMGTPHIWAINRLTEIFVLKLTGRAIVSVQMPFILDEHSLPQPDLAVLRRPKVGERPHPSAQTALLVVEVSDTTFSYDLDRKIPLYARAGVPEAWLVDIKRQSVHVFSDPRGDVYGLARVYLVGDMVISATIEGLEVSVAEILDLEQ